MASSIAVDIDDGRAYATTANNYAEPATDTSDAIIAFATDDGRMLWKNQRLAGDVWSTVDPATCDISWERQLPGPVLAPISVANGVGFVGADRHLQAFDTDTGEKLFDYVAPSTIASTPTIADGRVAFGSGISWSVGSLGTLLIVLALP